MMAQASVAPASSGRSIIYSQGQQFLLAPGSILDLNKPLPSIQSVQSAESSAHLLKGSQSLGSDHQVVDDQVVDKDQGEYLLAAAPTTQNLEKLQEHQSAAEELQAQDLIRAHPSASPRSAFWGEESRWVFPLCDYFERTAGHATNIHASLSSDHILLPCPELAAETQRQLYSRRNVLICMAQQNLTQALAAGELVDLIAHSL